MLILVRRMFELIKILLQTDRKHKFFKNIFYYSILDNKEKDIKYIIYKITHLLINQYRKNMEQNEVVLL